MLSSPQPPPLANARAFYRGKFRHSEHRRASIKPSVSNVLVKKSLSNVAFSRRTLHVCKSRKSYYVIQKRPRKEKKNVTHEHDELFLPVVSQGESRRERGFPRAPGEFFLRVSLIFFQRRRSQMSQPGVTRTPHNPRAFNTRSVAGTPWVEARNYRGKYALSGPTRRGYILD